MSDDSSDQEYGVDISDDDSALGIRWLEIPDMEGTSPRRVRAAVRILSPFDILVKTAIPDCDGFQYSHRRWGYNDTSGDPDNAEWHTLNPPGVMFSFDEAAQFLQEYDFASHDSIVEKMFGGIVGVKFEYHQL